MKRTGIVSLICGVALSGSPPTAFAQVSFLEEARSGIDLLEKGNPAAAEAALERAIDQAVETDVKGENRARTIYNLGLSQLRQGKFEPAVSSFNAASNESTDPTLQAKTFHNAGTSLAQYAAGVADGSAETDLPEGENPLAKASTVYEEALNYFRKSLLLNPDDADTKGSYEVTRKAKKAVDEALREQQEQQQQDSNDEQESEDENSSEEKQPSDGEDQKEDSSNGDQQDANSSDKQQDPSADPGGNPQDEPGEEQQPANPENGEEEGREDAQSESNQGEEPSENEPSGNPREVQAQQMTQEEAELLLDKIKQDENAQRVRARPRLGKPQTVDKDW